MGHCRDLFAKSCAFPPEAVVSMHRWRSNAIWARSGRSVISGRIGPLAPPCQLPVQAGVRYCHCPNRARRKSLRRGQGLAGCPARRPRGHQAPAPPEPVGPPDRAPAQGRAVAHGWTSRRRFDSPVGPGRPCSHSTVSGAGGSALAKAAAGKGASCMAACGAVGFGKAGQVLGTARFGAGA